MLSSEILDFKNDWTDILQKELEKPYFQSLFSFLEEEKNETLFPPGNLIFNAFRQTPYKSTSVVIMGQDPYHNYGQAHGLSFSVPQGVTAPPSLKNIFKELQSDLHLSQPNHGCLLSWAHQGVLLLNATLTVRKNEPKSHYGKGWEQFTDKIVEKLAEKKEPVVFLLWGKSAQEKCLRILNREEFKHHEVLQTTHPSPFSAHYGFLGSSHFSRVNKLLEKWGKSPIDWSII